MSIYFLETSAGDFSLSSTSKITKTLKGIATDNPVESGALVADHYVNKPDKFSLSGILTSVKLGTPIKSVIDTLTLIKETGEPFTFHYGSSITPAESCVIESLSFTQDSVNGFSGGTQNYESFKVSLSIKKIRLTDALLIVHERSKFVVDSTTDKKKSAGSTKETEFKTESEKQFALSKAGFKIFGGLFGP